MILSFIYHIELKAFIEASDICTLEKWFASATFEVCKSYRSEKIQKNVEYFGLCIFISREEKTR